VAGISIIMADDQISYLRRDGPRAIDADNVPGIDHPRSNRRPSFRTAVKIVYPIPVSGCAAMKGARLVDSFIFEILHCRWKGGTGAQRTA
jgi:hypothetical protein